MKLQRRVQILTAFGCRLLYMTHPVLSTFGKLTQLHRLIPIIGLRLFYLSPNESHDPTVTSILPHILTEAAMDYAIVSTSITALKPFLKPFHTGAIVNTIGGGGSGLYSGSHSGTPGIYMLSSVAKGKEDIGKATTSSVRSGSIHNDSQLRAKLYNDNKGEGTTVVLSRPDRCREDIESVESNGSEQMIIRTTKEWAIRYENS
jgi:hypothetical protein